MRRGWLLALAVLPALAAHGRDMSQPAELPPADFAGQQYVDSRGCMFVRAGTADQVLWIPRVSRGGVPLCDSPPSGRRVAIGAEAAPAVEATEEAGLPNVEGTAEASLPPQDGAATAGSFVAVGSFAQAENVAKAEARLSELGYGAVRGRLQGGASSMTTVFAGPFADAQAAAEALQALRQLGFPDAMPIGP